MTAYIVCCPALVNASDEIAEKRAEEYYLTQKAEQCGAASLFLCLKYYGIEISYDNFLDHIENDGGMTLQQFVDILRVHSLSASVLRDRRDIEKSLLNGHLVVMPIFSKKHFLVYLPKDDQEFCLEYNPPYSYRLASIDSVMDLWEGYVIEVTPRKAHKLNRLISLGANKRILYGFIAMLFLSLCVILQFTSKRKRN